MAPAAAPSPTRPIYNDAVAQVLDLSVPGLNFLQRFTAACWQMNESWLKAEGEKPGSDPWPTTPLERVVIAQRFYSAGLKAYLVQDWTAASENLGSALHLQLYPYSDSGMAMRLWHHYIASNDVNALAMRNWIGRLLILYGKTQLAWAKEINDIHAADMCYFSADAAAGILHGLQKESPETPFSEEGMRILFPGDSIESLADVDDALALRKECANTLVDLARLGDPLAFYHALLPRKVLFNPIRHPGDLVPQLQAVLHTPISVSSELWGRERVSDDEDDSDINGVQDQVVTITVDVDEDRMKKEGKNILRLKPLKALHAVAIVAAHANRDWFRKEVGIDCWDDNMNTPDMRKCREAVEMLWTTDWKKDEFEIEPTAASLMESMHLVQFATWQANQVLYGTTVGMRHAIGDIILSNTGFRWVFMDYYYKERLQDGTGEATGKRMVRQIAQSRPDGTIPNSSPVPCIDFSLLQNSLLQLNEGALRDLLIALKALELAQRKVGGPEAFWPLVEQNNGAKFRPKNTENGANQTLSPVEFHQIVGALIEASQNSPQNIKTALSSSRKKTSTGISIPTLDDKRPWERGALSMFGEGLGIPPVTPIPLHRRGVKALTGLMFISFDDAVIVLVLVLCLICAVSLYRALHHMFGWGIWWNKALNRSGSRGHSGSGGGGRSVASHSAWVIAQRNTAATGLREAIASESIPRLAAAVKAAEEAGVEKPLVKKGKNWLQHLKKRKAAGIAGSAAGGGSLSPSSLSNAANGSASFGSTSRTVSRNNSTGNRTIASGNTSTSSSTTTTNAASAAVAAMRLLTKKHTPVNSGDQAAEWAHGAEDEWVVVSPKSQHHSNSSNSNNSNNSNNQQQSASQFSRSPSSSPSSSSPSADGVPPPPAAVPAAVSSPVAMEVEKPKEAASTPDTPVRQPLPPSSQYASEEGNVLLAEQQHQQQQHPQQPSTPTAASPPQPQIPSKYTPSATESLAASQTGDGDGIVKLSATSAKTAAVVAATMATTTTAGAARMQQKGHNSSVQLSSSTSSVSSLSTSASEKSFSQNELKQTKALPPSRGGSGLPRSSSASGAHAPVPVQSVKRSVSDPFHEAARMKGIEMDNISESVYGRKQAPKVVLVKRSSMQQRPSPAAAAAAAAVAAVVAEPSGASTSTNSAQKLTAAGNKKVHPHAAAAVVAVTKPNPTMATTATAGSAEFTGHSRSTLRENAPAFVRSTSSATTQLPVLSFGPSFAAPTEFKMSAGTGSFAPVYGSAPQLLSARAQGGSGYNSGSLSATVAAENELNTTSSYLLAQAQWSPAAAAATASLSAAENAKFSPSPSAAIAGYDEIGYTDAWASIGNHFNNTVSPSLAAPLSPSCGAGAFNALSPSGPFDSRLPTNTVSTETSLGLSLIHTDSSLSTGLSGRTTSLPSGTGELLASLQQIWEGPASTEGSLTPSYASHNTTPQATPVSHHTQQEQRQWTSPGVVSAAGFLASPLGELLLPSAELAKLANQSADQQAHWLLGRNNSLSVYDTSNDPQSSFRGNHRAHSGSLADLGFEESSEF